MATLTNPDIYFKTFGSYAGFLNCYFKNNTYYFKLFSKPKIKNMDFKIKYEANQNLIHNIFLTLPQTEIDTIKQNAILVNMPTFDFYKLSETQKSIISYCGIIRAGYNRLNYF